MIDIEIPKELQGKIPTFEEFCNNPDKWRKHKENIFAEIEKGGTSINQITQRHEYEIEGYRCKSLEQLQSVVQDMGIPFDDLTYEPQVIPQSGGKCNILIKVMSKSRKEHRDGLQKINASKVG